LPRSATTRAASTNLDRRIRRLVRILALLGLVVAGVFYADKAADDRSAFIRWRPQVLRFGRGENIFDTMAFPNPPIMAICLYPLMVLPPLAGSLTWFAIKAGMTAVSASSCFLMVKERGEALSPWVEGSILLLCARPILGDLQHGNNNLLILFLVVSTLMAWRKGHDLLAGLLLAASISFKVTPALFLLYFLYKRSWRTVGMTCLGLLLFLLVIPGALIGPAFNLECLASWWRRMVGPFVEDGIVTTQEINQSLSSVLTRLLTATKLETAFSSTTLDVSLAAWSPMAVSVLVRALAIGLVGLLAWLCGTKADRRDDPRLFGEFALVTLTMLFVSERSWKHHYVTVLLPFTYLMYRVGLATTARWVRALLVSAVILAAVLMASTSSEAGGFFFGGQGHKLAQGYGMFLWAGVVLYAATAWRVWDDRRKEAQPDQDHVASCSVVNYLPGTSRWAASS
jgi:hypothetical protein